MKNVIKFFVFFVVLAFVLAGAISAMASEDIVVDKNSMNIVVDGERVFADNFVYESTTYVPLRRIAEMLGKKVEWNADVYGAFISDGESSVVTGDSKEGIELEKGVGIEVQRNTMKIFVNGVEVEADNFVYSETTYVPLRKISEMFKQEVYWEKLSNTAFIGEKGISFFDGKVLGTINGIEFTDYMYEYYASMYDGEYDYCESFGIDALATLGTKEEYIVNSLKKDYALIDFALKNGMSMTPFYNVSYYDSVKSTLEGVKGDMERFNAMLEMQGFTSLNSYYYAMLNADLFVQYASKFVNEITEDEVWEFYENNDELKYSFDYNEAKEDIVKIISHQRTEKEIEEMAKKLNVEFN